MPADVYAISLPEALAYPCWGHCDRADLDIWRRINNLSVLPSFKMQVGAAGQPRATHTTNRIAGCYRSNGRRLVTSRPYRAGNFCLGLGQLLALLGNYGLEA